MNARAPALRNQMFLSFVVGVLGMCVAWQVGNVIVAGDLRMLFLIGLGFAGCAVAIAILRNWRAGFYLFVGWLLFEDLVRKYMGNGAVFFFGKDVLLLIVYVSFMVAVGRGREKTFRPPFWFFFSLFFWLGVLQMFNPNSPHILYGLLGIKVYFYYVPLLFVGYALIRNDADLRKFLVFNAVLAGVIAMLGIAQAILGNKFLNPAKLDPNLADLGNLGKVTPLTNQAFTLPDSVFVSSGRYALYIVLMMILLLGAAAYFLLSGRRHRKLTFMVIGVLVGAALLSGSRTAVVGSSVSAGVLFVGFLWGAKWRQEQSYRLTRAIRRSIIVGALGLAVLILLFPAAAGSRIAFYTETLNPNSTAYAGESRAWDYPIANLEAVFQKPNWVVGNGIGTASLGMQYVARALGQAQPNLWVEEGYGVLIIEMGIIAPFLWILWTAALLYYSWKVVRRLKGTRLVPLAIAIFWYAFFLLYPFTYNALSPYQDYMCNAYLWLLVGILFRLPDLLENSVNPDTVLSTP
ncbi:MAG TPA: hypothetical protein VGR97_03505 [Candidatus Acidoferrales bacterium]|nr:hypothetical protein [Candidatus Acidoferrales bacterium]